MNEELTFDEVGHLCVAVAVCLPVELEQALVHRPLQLQSVLHRLKGRFPLRLGGLLDILRGGRSRFIGTTAQVGPSGQKSDLLLSTLSDET